MGATVLQLHRIRDSGAHSPGTKDASQCETENPTMVPSALWNGVPGAGGTQESGLDAPHPLSPRISTISIQCHLSLAHLLSANCMPGLDGPV